MKVISEAKSDKFRGQYIPLLQLGFIAIGMAASFWLLYLLYVFFAFDGIHPINIVFRYLGATPVVGLNIPDFMELSIYDLTPVIISAVSAVGIYLGMAGIIAGLTYKLISDYAK
ncbi:hypothetical protein [Pseudomonas sp. PS01301]|uniref:hypothetical protein n=1 Tax=Pseudomonas sp. PS01301 TaxID=2991437 RepID=UPI00249A3D53|nr:hypothetical protein [Pseudomonas sp. PS01301]